MSFLCLFICQSVSSKALVETRRRAAIVLSRQMSSCMSLGLRASVLSLHKCGRRQALASRQGRKARGHGPTVKRPQGKKGTSVKRRVPAKFQSSGLGALEEQGWGGAAEEGRRQGSSA